MARTPPVPVAIRDSARRLTLPRSQRFRTTAAFAPAAAAGVLVYETHLHVQSERQQKTEWCWAAVTVALARFYFPNQPPPAQCELATTVSGDQCCPVDPHDPAGNVPEALEDVLPDVHLQSTLGFRYFPHEVRQALALGCPLVALIEWDQPVGNHFVIIDGVGTLDGTDYLHICDSRFANAAIPYDDLANNYQPLASTLSGTWTQTHLVTRVGG